MAHSINRLVCKSSVSSAGLTSSLPSSNLFKSRQCLKLFTSLRNLHLNIINMVRFYAFLLALLLATSSALAFPIPEYVLLVVVNCTYVLMYVIYRGQKKITLHQRDLDQEVSETRRELLSDRDTYYDDGFELEPRAGMWDRVR